MEDRSDRRDRPDPAAQRLRRGGDPRPASRWRRRARRALDLGRRASRPLRRLSRRVGARPQPARQIHVSWSEDPARSLTVSWWTATDPGAARLEIRAVGRDAWRPVEGVSRPSPGLSGLLQRVVVRDLEPATAYEYRVAGDRGAEPAWSPAFRTRTAPDAPDAAFEAVFLCDTGIPGRPDGTSDAARRVVDALLADPPLLLLGGGDYAYANRDPRFRDPLEAIDGWFSAFEPLLARVPLMAQYGNHEVRLHERFEDWSPRFAHPPGEDEGRSYAFDVGPAHFSALFAPGEVPSARHLRWLDADLARARSRGARWLVVFQHAPLFAHGRSHPSKATMSEAILPILLRHRVDLHLSGHDQSYERTHPMGLDAAGSPRAAAMPGPGEPIAAGSGVVCAKISPAGKLSDRGRDFSRFTTAAPPFVAARCDALHHVGRLRVSSEALEVEVVGLDAAVGGTGSGEAPRAIDRFRIE